MMGPATGPSNGATPYSVWGVARSYGANMSEIIPPEFVIGAELP